MVVELFGLVVYLCDVVDRSYVIVDLSNMHVYGFEMVV